MKNSKLPKGIKSSGLVIAGRISDIFKVPDIEWGGIIAPDLDILRERGFLD